jgi:peroxiredoxin Q/BCP
MALKAGNRAPDFTLPDQDGKLHKLSAYQGKWVLLYFYPKDDTPGCTREACAIRDQHAAFKRLGTVVLGVSADPVSKHAKFAAKYDLPFTLLADEDKQVVAKYGVWGQKKFMGREFLGIHRRSFLIDPKGKLACIYEQVKPDAHAGEVLEDRRRLGKGAK